MNFALYSSYDVCNDVIPHNQAAFCAMGICQCPLVAKDYVGNDIPYEIPKRGGKIFAKILEGDYTSNITFYNKQSDRIYGCVGMKFTVKKKTV